MKSAQKLFFWPSWYSSMLCFIQCHQGTATIRHVLSITDASALSITDKGILTGGNSLRYNSYCGFFQGQSIYECRDNNDEVWGVAGKTALLLSGMMNRLAMMVQDQFGAEIEDDAELIILDFYGFLHNHQIRNATVLTQYTGYRVVIVNGVDLLSGVIEKNKLTPLDRWLIADEAGQEIHESSHNNVIHADIRGAVEDLVEQMLKAQIEPGVARYAVYEFLQGLQMTGKNDWTEYAATGSADSPNWPCLIDRIHFETRMLDICRRLVSAHNIHNQSTVGLAGSFAHQISNILKRYLDVRTVCYSREDIIRLIINQRLLTSDQYSSDQSFRLQINEQPAGMLNLQPGNILEEQFFYTLKLFGRDKERIRISLHDEMGRFIEWQCELKAMNMMDIYELPIWIKTDERNHFECVIENSGQLYLAGLKQVLYENGKKRSGPNMNDLISI